MGLKHKKKRTKKDNVRQVPVAVSPTCSTIVEECSVVSRRDQRQSIIRSNDANGTCDSALIPSVCVVKGDVAGPVKASCEEVPENADAVSEDAKSSPNRDNDVARQPADDEISSTTSCSPDSKNNTNAFSVKHKIRLTKAFKTEGRRRRNLRNPVKITTNENFETKTQRSLRDVVSSFAAETASDDERARDLEIINNAIESNPNYLSRCSLRNDLMSLGVVKGVTFASNTMHPALSRELYRLIQCEARDLIIQEHPKGLQDSQCAVDLLFEWFDSSKDPDELLRKHQLLRILAKHGNEMTEMKWDQLMAHALKIFGDDVQEDQCEECAMTIDELGSGRESLAKSSEVRSTSCTSLCDVNESHPESASTSPAPSDPDHEEKSNTSLKNKTNLVDFDVVTLKTSAPMPKAKMRPRGMVLMPCQNNCVCCGVCRIEMSVSRHRATRLALIPPNERVLLSNIAPQDASQGDHATTTQKDDTAANRSIGTSSAALPNPIRSAKCQSYSMSFVAVASPVTARQSNEPSKMLSQPNDLEPVLKDASVLPSPPDPLALKSPSSTSNDIANSPAPSHVSDDILEKSVRATGKRERVGGESCNEKVPPENVTLVRIHSDATISTALSVSDATQCDFIDAEPATSASYGQSTVDKARQDSAPVVASAIANEPCSVSGPSVPVSSASQQPQAPLQQTSTPTPSSSSSSSPPPPPPPPPPPAPPPPPVGFLSPDHEYGEDYVPEVRTSGASPPPPPPPPPPPGILAQPSKSASSPMSPSCTARSDEIYPKKKKTYTLLWQAVSQHSITNVHTVWNEYSRPEFGVEERDHVQLLFERAEPSALSRFATERRSVREKTTAESIFQLPQQKALNLEIILAKLRPLTVMDLIERLESNNVDGIAIDLLSSLLKYFPTDEEMLLFKKAAREEVKRNCDVLCWEAARRSTLKMRTELAIAREQILQDLSRHAQSIQKIRDVCSALRSRVLIHLMHKCLQYGNYINQGTALSRAVGFSLSSLTSILSAKGKQNSSTNLRLVDLLAQYVEFETVALEDAISRLSLARSITLVDIENASRELTSSVKRLKQQLESRADGDASLLEAYQPFLEVAESSCSNLESDLREIRSTEGSLQSFLCANSMKLEEIVSVTYEALTMLSDSIKKRATVKMRSTSVISNRQLAGRERFAMQRRSLQPTRLSVDEMRQMFLEAANQ